MSNSVRGIFLMRRIDFCSRATLDYDREAFAVTAHGEHRVLICLVYRTAFKCMI